VLNRFWLYDMPYVSTLSVLLEAVISCVVCAYADAAASMQAAAR